MAHAPNRTSEPHHHRATTKTTHKPFKSRHLTKSALKNAAKGKISLLEDKGKRRTPSQQVMSKIERRNQAKQKRLVQKRDHERDVSVFAGRDGAPRIVAVVPLCTDGSATKAVNKLCDSVDLEGMDLPKEGWVRVPVERFKQNLGFVMVKRDLLLAMDACRVADFVLFVLSAKEEVDEFGELMIKSIESQGLSNTLITVQGLDDVEPSRKRASVVTSLKSYIAHFLPNVEKVNSLDSRQECLNVVRTLCSTTPKGVRWREDRSWMFVEEVSWPSGKAAADGNKDVGEVVLTGVIRGKGLKSDRLLQVSDWGDFQINKITAAPLEHRKKANDDSMTVDAEAQGSLLDEPTEDQDDLEELAPEEVVMDNVDFYEPSSATTERKGVLLDDHHYFDDDDYDDPQHLPKRLPRGTSKYQATWYLDDVDYSGSDMESVDENFFEANLDDAPLDPADGIEDVNMGEQTEAMPSEYPQSEAFLDPSPEDEAEAIEAYRETRRHDVEEDLEFPDEIELHPNVLARERLARYRGLKNLRTSKWETEEDKPYEPAEWSRLLEVKDYKGAKNRIFHESLLGGVKSGTRVNIHLRNVPLHLQQHYEPSQPLPAFSLLRHEHKRTVVHFSITLSSDLETAIKSKEEMIMQCGPRRLIINPLFSQTGTTANDVHKFYRYLHPGCTAIASFIAPLTWGPTPTLFFKSNNSASELQLVGTGTSLPPSQSRVIAKRIILTGHPFKIHKRVVTVRYMFFNTEDVAWFKALQLWTKRGRCGFIKESLGTHGYFKATFDGRINPMDAVAVSLYKRVWPKWAKIWKPCRRDGVVIADGF
jgi:pre-rRNA-processing protein TSR1